MLKDAEDIFKNAARKLLTQIQQQQLSSAPMSNISNSGAQTKISALENPWKECIDQELVTLESTADSFASPKDALKAIIDWHVAIATDPAVNGGFMLVPVRQPKNQGTP